MDFFYFKGYALKIQFLAWLNKATIAQDLTAAREGIQATWNTTGFPTQHLTSNQQNYHQVKIKKITVTDRIIGT